MVDPFRITSFQNPDDGRDAEYKLKALGIWTVLSDTCDLYVSTEQLDRAMEVLSLPAETRNAPQPGPWCNECGYQLVSKKERSTRPSGIGDRIPRFLPLSRNWYCYQCDNEIKDRSRLERIKGPIKRALVKAGYYSKPNFLIIGAQKAGTSAMFQILQQHPQIIAPDKKELRFFDETPQIIYGDSDSYHAMFPLPYELKPDKLTFEASPSYLFNPICAERIYQYAPEIRLVVILREPVSRAYSAWNMHKRFLQSANPFLRSLGDSRSFEDAIKEEIEVFEKTAWEKHLFAYIKRGVYVEQLERYFQLFSRDTLLVVEHSRLLHDSQTVFAEIFRFLGIDDQRAIQPQRVNVSSNNGDMPKETRERLHSIYKPYNEKLFTLLGREYDW